MYIDNRYRYLDNPFYRFRNNQDENVTGISRTARVLRKRSNLVTMRFNMINWLLETVSLVLVMFKENVFLNILYLLVNSCGTPLVNQFNIYFFWYFTDSFFLVYFLGMEENRRVVREHFQSMIRKNRVDPNQTVET